MKKRLLRGKHKERAIRDSSLLLTHIYIYIYIFENQDSNFIIVGGFQYTTCWK